jgi:hypothetical protein
MNKFKIVRKANGNAEMGDLVRYHDIANQNCNVFKIIDCGSERGYKLIDIESEDLIINFSDLRQYGWDVLEKVEV